MTSHQQWIRERLNSTQCKTPQKKIFNGKGEEIQQINGTNSSLHILQQYAQQLMLNNSNNNQKQQHLQSKPNPNQQSKMLKENNAHSYQKQHQNNNQQINQKISRSYTVHKFEKQINEPSIPKFDFIQNNKNFYNFDKSQELPNHSKSNNKNSDIPSNQQDFIMQIQQLQQIIQNYENIMEQCPKCKKIFAVKKEKQRVYTETTQATLNNLSPISTMRMQKTERNGNITERKIYTQESENNLYCNSGLDYVKKNLFSNFNQKYDISNNNNSNKVQKLDQCIQVESIQVDIKQIALVANLQNELKILHNKYDSLQQQLTLQKQQMFEEKQFLQNENQIIQNEKLQISQKADELSKYLINKIDLLDQENKEQNLELAIFKEHIIQQTQSEKQIKSKEFLSKENKEINKLSDQKQDVQYQSQLYKIPTFLKALSITKSL